MQKESAQAKILLKVVGGLLFLTHPVVCNNRIIHLFAGWYREYSVSFTIVRPTINERFLHSFGFFKQK